MDAVTYPDETTARFIAQNFIPVRLQYNQQPYAKDFNIKWTPTLITLDNGGEEHHRTVGFLGPSDFIASQTLGIGKYHFDLEHFDKALEMFERVISNFPKSECAAEAVYLKGVATYKKTHQAGPLKEAYERLSAEYAKSEWAKRAEPYRLL